MSFTRQQCYLLFTSFSVHNSFLDFHLFFPSDALAMYSDRKHSCFVTLCVFFFGFCFFLGPPISPSTHTPTWNTVKLLSGWGLTCLRIWTTELTLLSSSSSISIFSMDLLYRLGLLSLDSVSQYVRSISTPVWVGTGLVAAATTYLLTARPNALPPICDLDMQSIEIPVSLSPSQVMVYSPCQVFWQCLYIQNEKKNLIQMCILANLMANLMTNWITAEFRSEVGV